MTNPSTGKRIPLFMIEVFLYVKEGIKEYRSLLTFLQVMHADLTRDGRPNHVQHLQIQSVI